MWGAAARHDGPMDTDVSTHDITIDGESGSLVGIAWTMAQPRWVAVLVHGYGEHVGRYSWVAQQLTIAGASVYGADHVGHGRSHGQRAVIRDVEPVVSDVGRVVDLAAAENPGLPVVLIGHSMGGLIAARAAQRFGDRFAAVVLTGPVLGRWDVVEDLLSLPEIPPTPIDPATLSRDPAVGEAYAADPLVWHGDFQRPTLAALHQGMERVTINGTVGAVPLLHLHGGDDQLVPVGPSQKGLERIRGGRTEATVYPGARHEILNETNRDEVMADILAFVGRYVPVRG